MRAPVITLVMLLATHAAAAKPIIDQSAPWQDRINACVARWNNATAVQRGTMTYRQFTTKCVGGKTTLPIEAKATCVDGSVSPATSPGGACASNGGVRQWMQ